MKPYFQKKISIPVRNYLTGDNYFLKRIDEVQPTEKRIKEITSICNEPAIYSWLFQDIFGGEPYSVEKAEGFFKNGVDGWEQSNKYIFLLISAKGNIAAAIDIKSAELDNAEIGYWASKSHRGCMTNTASALLNLARDAGYRNLFGRTKKNNKDSVGVLLRAGFLFDFLASKESETYDFYRIKLQAN